MAGRSYLGSIGGGLRWGATRIGQRLRPRMPLRLRLTHQTHSIFGVDGADRRRQMSVDSPLDLAAFNPQHSQRRADVARIFDAIGLAPFPTQLWRFVDSADDPRQGADDFLRAIGISPARVQAGDAAEIDRANEVLELLFGIDTVFDRVAPKVAAALEARLCSGDYAAVREAAGAADTFERIARLGRRWPKSDRIAVLDAFLEEVEAGLANPLAIRATDVALAERIGDRLSRQMMAFDAAMQATWALHYSLAMRWPPHWGATEAWIRSSALARAESLEKVLRRDRRLRPRDVDMTIRRLESANARLERLTARINRRSVRNGPDAAQIRRKSALTDLDQAFAFFEMDRTSRLDRSALRQRFRALARKLHPDQAEPDAASQQAAHARFVTLNRHYDLLKLQL
ncbi:MAG: hypothetical protein B7Y43_08470 [Sphingomonas sp. 28-62-20]|nr:MAG: hypothetical protein B7Y43_08470 [Sphingomonas sp. 28-62-20]